MQLPLAYLQQLSSNASVPERPHTRLHNLFYAAAAAFLLCDWLLLAACRNGAVRIRLDGDEASDVINFVLKDEATNTW
jgi:hypothetical protein